MSSSLACIIFTPETYMETFTKRNTWMVQNYNVEPVLSVFNDGGLILYPTDTIWCIGCDATHPEAVERVKNLRQCDFEEPFTLLAASLDMLKFYVPDVHPRVETLLNFHARPLTVVYDQALHLPQNTLGPDGSVAFRIPLDEFCLTLLKVFGKPIVAEPAHTCGAPYPHHFGEISSAIIQGVDYVVKHRQMDKNMAEPSVVARMSDEEELVFLRE